MQKLVYVSSYEAFLSELSGGESIKLSMQQRIFIIDLPKAYALTPLLPGEHLNATVFKAFYFLDADLDKPLSREHRRLFTTYSALLRAADNADRVLWLYDLGKTTNLAKVSAISEFLKSKGLLKENFPIAFRTGIFGIESKMFLDMIREKTGCNVL